MGATLTSAELLADSILKESGSALHNYSMQRTRLRIIAAAQKGIAGRDELIEVAKWVHAAFAAGSKDIPAHVAADANAALKLAGVEVSK